MRQGLESGVVGFEVVCEGCEPRADLTQGAVSVNHLRLHTEVVVTVGVDRLAVVFVPFGIDKVSEFIIPLSEGNQCRIYVFSPLNMCQYMWVRPLIEGAPHFHDCLSIEVQPEADIDDCFDAVAEIFRALLRIQPPLRDY
jgi:hypothetical protein